MNRKKAISNDVWCARVRGMLHEGYGVEDIARRLKCDEHAVRAEVSILREIGVLARMWPGARA